VFNIGWQGLDRHAEGAVEWHGERVREIAGRFIVR
jgi:hypothetical protein